MNNFWDERYSNKDFFYGTKPNDFLRENVSLLKPNSQILCLAEGEGRNAVYLAELGHNVIAVDSSQVGLDKMQVLAQSKNLTVKAYVEDLTTFNLGEASYDTIVSIWCHLPSLLRKNLHQRCIQALRPQGLFIMESYTPKQLEYKTGGPQNSDLLVSIKDIQVDLQGLTLLHAKELIRHIDEGAGHLGQSSVLQVIAQKK